MKIKSNLEFSDQFNLAFDLLENSRKHIFLTGKAGTGKSTLLQYFRNNTSKNIAVLAPTGVAAINVKGQTIHSFFGFKPDITPDSVDKIRVRKSKRKIYENTDTIIIDEISMVRADLLDCIDAFLKIHGPRPRETFGGVQIIFIGDLYQLPPVVTYREREIFRDVYKSPFFFDAKVFEHIDIEFMELEEIYRQKDEEFIDLLNAIRNRTVNPNDLKLLNERYIPNFDPEDDQFYIHLTTTNNLADTINQEQLQRSKKRTYKFEGFIEGEFEEKNLPTQNLLEIQVGAQVMLLNNEQTGKWVNGSIGKVIAVNEGVGLADVINVQLSNGRVVEVAPFTWEMFRFYYNEETESLDSQTVGAFTQYPLKLAWAVTIHKSQGKTFNKVIIDIGEGTFSHGQIYVALSRCTRLEGIVLKKPILRKHLILDWRVVEFMARFQTNGEGASGSIEAKRNLLERAIERQALVEVLYVTANGEQLRRILKPIHVSEMDYFGQTFLGVEGFCHNLGGRRAFRLDRIIEIKEGVNHEINI